MIEAKTARLPNALLKFFPIPCRLTHFTLAKESNSYLTSKKKKLHKKKKRVKLKVLWSVWGSNSRPWRYQHHALPTELTDQHALDNRETYTYNHLVQWVPKKIINQQFLIKQPYLFRYHNGLATVLIMGSGSDTILYPLTRALLY